MARFISSGNEVARDTFMKPSTRDEKTTVFARFGPYNIVKFTPVYLLIKHIYNAESSQFSVITINFPLLLKPSYFFFFFGQPSLFLCGHGESCVQLIKSFFVVVAAVENFFRKKVNFLFLWKVYSNFLTLKTFFFNIAKLDDVCIG